MRGPSETEFSELEAARSHALRRIAFPTGSDRLRLLSPQLLTDHRRDTVPAHRHAVQRVRDLHRPLLVRDHDELRRLPQLLHDADQPAVWTRAATVPPMTSSRTRAVE